MSKLHCEGFLTKQGGGTSVLGSKSWKRRYFVLSDNRVYYYKKKDDKLPLGVISLEGRTVHEADTKTGKPYSFEIHHPERRCYFAYAENEEDRRKWIDCLTQACDARVQSMLEVNERFRKMYSGVCSSLDEFMQGLKAQVGQYMPSHLTEIIQLGEKHGAEKVGEMIDHCTGIRAFHKNTVRRFVEPPKVQPEDDQPAPSGAETTADDEADDDAPVYTDDGPFRIPTNTILSSSLLALSDSGRNMSSEEQIRLATERIRVSPDEAEQVQQLFLQNSTDGWMSKDQFKSFLKTIADSYEPEDDEEDLNHWAITLSPVFEGGPCLADRFFEIVDCDRNQSIDYLELCSFLAAFTRGEVAEKLKLAFAFFDYDSDEKVLRGEFVDMCGMIMNVMPFKDDPELEQIFNVLGATRKQSLTSVLDVVANEFDTHDDDRDGSIQFSDFMKMILDENSKSKIIFMQFFAAFELFGEEDDDE